MLFYKKSAFLCIFMSFCSEKSRAKPIQKVKNPSPRWFFFHFIGEADIGTEIWHFAHFRDNL